MSRQILPCWCAHARMGHSVLYGYAEPYAGTSIVLTVPAIEGDDQHGPLVEEVHVLPMEGPAFYGFEVLTEDGVRARLASKRPWKPATFLPAPVEEDAVEVSAEEPALDCKPLGTLLDDLTAEDLAALPEGSRFEDPSDGDAMASHGFECSFVNGLGRRWVSEKLGSLDGDDLISDWGACPYRLTRIGPAPIVQAAPISSDVRPAAAVGQRVFVSIARGSFRSTGWYDVTGIEADRIILDDGREYLTPDEWNTVATVMAYGVTLFDEMPF